MSREVPEDVLRALPALAEGLFAASPLALIDVSRRTAEASSCSNWKWDMAEEKVEVEVKSGEVGNHRGDALSASARRQFSLFLTFFLSVAPCFEFDVRRNRKNGSSSRNFSTFDHDKLSSG